jgi:quercetin dioxygenase-like cupin family protein
MPDLPSPRAVPTVKIDNERVRVVEWRFAPGASTGPHRHEWPYVVVPMTTGALALTAPDGTASSATLVTGEPYFRPAGVEHDVRNPNPGEFVFVEIEIKIMGGPDMAPQTPPRSPGPE